MVNLFMTKEARIYNGEKTTGSDFSQNKENFSKSRVNAVYFSLNFFSINHHQMELLNLKKKYLFLFSLNTTDNLILSQQTPRNKTLDPPEKTGQ